MRGIFAMTCLLLAFATFAQADDECLGCADRIKAAVDYCNVSIKKVVVFLYHDDPINYGCFLFRYFLPFHVYRSLTQ